MVKTVIWHPIDENLASDAKDWAEFKNEYQPGSYKVIADRINCFDTINDDDILILLCHGHTSNEIKTKKQPKPQVNNQTIEYYTIPENENADSIKQDFTAEDIANHLINNGLKTTHKVIELASCHSNEVARFLYESLKSSGFNNITVYGYCREYIEPNINFPNGLANLAGDEVLPKGKLTEERTDEQISRCYDAKLVRFCYGDETLILKNNEERTLLRKTAGFKDREIEPSKTNLSPFPKVSFFTMLERIGANTESLSSSSSALDTKSNMTTVYANQASSAIYQVLPEAPATYKEALIRGLFLSGGLSTFKDNQLQSDSLSNQIKSKLNITEEDSSSSHSKMKR